MKYDLIIENVQKYVTNLYETHKDRALYYHDLEHAASVASYCDEMSTHYNLEEKDHCILLCAAWFHDTGYLLTKPEYHEEKSVELMRNFFTDYIAAEEALQEMVDGIADCILATKIPRHPTTLVQEILCDADMYELATDKFFVNNSNLKREMRKTHGYEAKGWKKTTAKFLKDHFYFTKYCQEKLSAGLKDNINKFTGNVQREEPEEQQLAVTDKSGKKAKFSFVPGKEQAKSGDNDKTSLSFINKGIQTMLRLTSENHMELSAMADGKANILISVNAIIISIILSVLLRRLEVDPHLTIPTLIFLASSVVTIIVAILSTRPKMSQGAIIKEDVLSKKTNLLFFGNFYRSSHEDYKWAMSVMMKDPNYIYGSVVDDIYYLGVILGRKYRLIRLAYNVFMIGIIVSVIAFIIAILWKQQAGDASANTPQFPL